MDEVLLGKETEMENEKPPYPQEPGKRGDSFTNRIEDAEEPGSVEKQVYIDTKALAADLVRAGFQTANLINPKIREATETEIRNIGMPLASVIDKYDLVRYAKYLSYTQEVTLAFNLIKAIQVRVKEVKDDKRINPVED